MRDALGEALAARPSGVRDPVAKRLAVRGDFLCAQLSELRQGGYHLLFDLLRPHLPLYGLALLLMAFDSAVGAANWHGIASLLDGVDNGTMSLEELKGVFVQSCTPAPNARIRPRANSLSVLGRLAGEQTQSSSCASSRT